MKNLERIRKKKKMTTEAVAVAADIPYATVRAYERCIREATVSKAWRIAAVLGVTIEDLIK
jgi:transcriptional regulator with XRE-family HTH domain